MEWAKVDVAPKIYNNIKGSKIELKVWHHKECRVCRGKIYSGDTAFWFPRKDAWEHYNCNRRKNK